MCVKLKLSIKLQPMKKPDALIIVNSIFPSADTQLVNLFLEQSKGTKNGQFAYRPYAVAARLLSATPPNENIKRVETLEFFDSRQDRINELIEMQAMEDSQIENIPYGWLAIDKITPLPLSVLVSESDL